MVKLSIKTVIGDITSQQVDAIVNAANSTLRGGGGVDGAIHRAAGPELDEYCRRLKGCKTGEAVITPGFNLPAPYIIHTVGPVYGAEAGNEDALLARCYQSCLRYLDDPAYTIHSIAFPAISTGAYGFPKDHATAIAHAAVSKWLETHPDKTVIFVEFPA